MIPKRASLNIDIPAPIDPQVPRQPPPFARRRFECDHAPVAPHQFRRQQRVKPVMRANIENHHSRPQKLITNAASAVSNPSWISSRSSALRSASHHAPNGNRSGTGIDGTTRLTRFASATYRILAGFATNRRTRATNVSCSASSFVHGSRPARGSATRSIQADCHWSMRCEQHRPPPRMIARLAKVIMLWQPRHAVHVRKSRAIQHLHQARLARIKRHVRQTLILLQRFVRASAFERRRPGRTCSQSAILSRSARANAESPASGSRGDTAARNTAPNQTSPSPQSPRSLYLPVRTQSSEIASAPRPHFRIAHRTRASSSPSSVKVCAKNPTPHPASSALRNPSAGFSALTTRRIVAARVRIRSW